MQLSRFLSSTTELELPYNTTTTQNKNKIKLLITNIAGHKTKSSSRQNAVDSLSYALVACNLFWWLDDKNRGK